MEDESGGTWSPADTANSGNRKDLFYNGGSCI